MRFHFMKLTRLVIINKTDNKTVVDNMENLAHLHIAIKM